MVRVRRDVRIELTARSTAPTPVFKFTHEQNKRLPPYGMIFLRIHKCFHATSITLRNFVKNHVTHRGVPHHKTSPKKGERLLPELTADILISVERYVRDECQSSAKLNKRLGLSSFLHIFE
jgi:hypothetical protein